MYPEQSLFSEDAETLANLLSKSFEVTFSTIQTDSLSDKEFVKALSATTVFVFEDEDNDLFAFFPFGNLARITNVVFDGLGVNKIPPELKSWFIPGHPIPVLSEKQLNDCEYDFHGVVLLDTDDDILVQLKEDNRKNFSVTKTAGDYLITIHGTTYALVWPKDNPVAISTLKQLICHKWIALRIFDTDIVCDKCDGYDYSRCDMSRCKNNCELCGGRRFKCNNSCFYHRYKKYLAVSLMPLLFQEGIKKGYEALRVFNEALNKTEECKNWEEVNKVFIDHQLLKERFDFIRELYHDCSFIEETLGDDGACEFVSEYGEMVNKLKKIFKKMPYESR